MKCTFALIIGMLVAGAPLTATAVDSTGVTAKSGKLVVSAVFAPTPPKQGIETIKVTVESPTGKPVTGATVSVATNMPTMSMTGPTLKAHDAGNGVYIAKANLNFATQWTFDVTASSGSQNGTTHLKADVK